MALAVEQLNLNEGESVVFDSPKAVLTNLRLVAAPSKHVPETAEVLLKDIASFQRITGGTQSRLRMGLYLLGAGVAINVASVVLQAGSVPTIIDILMFLAGMTALIAGMYLTLHSVLRVRPHTTILFLVPGGVDVPVVFEGKDNPQAEDLTRTFARAKRGI